jgi:hypothetical protein
VVVNLQLIRSGGGWRKTRSDDVAQSICSFCLVPEDGQALPPFKPGQFLSSCSELGHEPNPQGRPRRLVIAIATVVIVYPHLMAAPGRLRASCHECCGRRPVCHDWPSPCNAL